MEGFRSVDVNLHCNKNHAAELGRHGTDGCREFFHKHGSLKCEVCGFHRYFHFKKAILVESESLVNQAPKENGRPRRISLKNQNRKQTPGTLLKNQGLKQMRKPRRCYTVAEKIRLADYAERHGWRMPGRKGDRSELKSLCAELGLLEKQVGDWMYARKKKRIRCVGH